MNRNLNSTIVVFLFSLHVAGAQVPAPAHAAAVSRHPAELRHVRLSGELQTRYMASTCNLLTRSDRYSMNTFRANALGVPGSLWWDWPGDQFGRWLSVLHVAEALGWSAAAHNRNEVLKTILPLQREGGYFGTVPVKNTDSRVPSGNAFGLRGLMDAYEDTRDTQLLKAASRMVDFFEENFDYYANRGHDGAIDEYYAHCIDGLVKLYTLGGNSRALSLAEKAAHRLADNGHTHHSLSAYRGVIDLFRVTGKTEYLQKVKHYLKYIRDNRIASGGVPEHMPFSDQDEGCALADYVLTNLMMFEVTGEDDYIGEAERCLVNHFFMNQFHTGGFGHRSYGAEILGGKQWQGWNGEYGSENPGCCSLWGQWALGQVGQYIFTENGEDIEVNLYAEAEVEFPDKGLTLQLTGDFPASDKVSLVLLLKDPRSFRLKLRIPQWADEAVVRVNGAEVKQKAVAGRLTLERKWHPGDRVEVSFRTPYRVEHWPGKSSPMGALYRGPLCYGVSSADGNVDNILELVTDARQRLVIGENGSPLLMLNGHPANVILRPIGDDWLSGNVKDPNRIRILFPIIKN